MTGVQTCALPILAIVVVGGLLYATLMTLFIIPVMYDIFYKKQPHQVDIGEDDLDDILDEAQEYMNENEWLEEKR